MDMPSLPNSPATAPTAEELAVGENFARISAIVLAAGYSSRMGRFKPLLPLGGSPVLERTVGLFTGAGVRDVAVVVGHRADELIPLVTRAGARAVLNADFDAGMFSSVCAGVRALPPESDACFLLPADMPLIRPATLRALLKIHRMHPQAIVFPVFEGRRGHPPLVPCAIVREAIDSGSAGPLSAILHNPNLHAIEVEVPDEAIHLDMDSPKDYEALLACGHRADLPNERECKAILRAQGVAEATVLHSEAVAAIALQLAHSLEEKGHPLDIELVHAAALLHDVAKRQPDHAKAGAAILNGMGFPAVGRVVAAHTELPPDCEGIDERALVFLADKLVAGTQFAGVERRFQPALERFRAQPEALAAAEQRLRQARRVASAVESILGMKLQDHYVGHDR